MPPQKSAKRQNSAAQERQNVLAAAANNAIASIGVKIREFRQDSRFTLQELASATGLSVSQLSMVERGRAKPSIGALVIIADALKVTVADLVASKFVSTQQFLVRAVDQQSVQVADIVVRLLREDRARGLSISINEYEPRTPKPEQLVKHDGFEYGFVLDGRPSVELDGISYELAPGDLIFFDSRRAHRFWNSHSKSARTLWFNLRSQ
jgi:transcriptional regulator with XRE-family HTH domain